jgi:nucleotide-binding universal stress UspA family protein
MRTKKILVPVNFSQASDAALVFATRMASPMKAKVTCLYVNEELDSIARKFIPRDINTRIRRHAEEMLSLKANEIIRPDNLTSFEVIVSNGKPYQKILEKARDLSTDIIVMGKSDSSNHHPEVLGSNTRRIITKSDIPVMVVTGGTGRSLNNLLLPLDLLKTVDFKLAKAIEMARLLQLDLNVLAVITSGSDGLRGKCVLRLEEIRKIVIAEGIGCGVRLCVSGRPVHEEILQYAATIHASLIMLMVQQEGRPMDYLIGTTAQSIICKSRIPIFSINTEVRSHTPGIKRSAGEQLVPIKIKDRA